jgi:ubiquinone/menaquinone biosynthesis C-methylase UbiE
MEKKFRTNQGKRILELGVGAGEHLPFVKDDYVEYVGIDLVPRVHANLEVNFPKVKIESRDALNTKFEDNRFDRIIATCLIAHFANVEEALSEWWRICRDGATISIYVPAEPGLALRIFRNLYSKMKANHLGFNGYDLFIAREHISSHHRIMAIISNTFDKEKMTILRRPFPFFGWYFNLFSVVHITVHKGSQA